MSNVEKFEELLRSDETLQAKLVAAAEAFTGDKSDERAVFDAVFAPLAAEADLPFTYDEGKAFATDSAVDDGDLASVAAGAMDEDGEPNDNCWIIGLGGGADACLGEYAGAGACLSVGVGLIHF